MILCLEQCATNKVIHMNQETRNLIMAASLSMLVLVLWQMYYINPMQEEAARQYAEQQKTLPSGELSSDTLSPAVAAVETFKSREETLVYDRRVLIETDALNGSISLKGARIDDLSLRGYRQSLEPDSEEVVLLSPQGTKQVYFADFGWLSDVEGLELPNGQTVWSVEGNATLRVGQPVKLRWKNSQGMVFTREFALDDHYMFTITQRIENHNGETFTVSPYGRITRAREEQQSMYISHEGPLGVFDDVLTEVTYDDIKEEEKTSYKKGKGWLGIADKYWLTAWIPSEGQRFDANFRYYTKQGVDRYQVDFLGEAMALPASGTLEMTQRFFAGAKKIRMLDDYSERYNIHLFDRAVDLGWLYFLTRPMLAALIFFKNLFGSFALAVLSLTVLVRLLLFPLADKSYRSMAQMRALQPEIAALRERYKDDRMKMNQEMMRFYSEKKINPMAGCLPMLVQIPIFFALYKVLFITIEMRHAPFYGWIDDLSVPDPTNLFNLFGLLPWDPPGFLPEIGVWACMFGITMVVQQRLNPAPTDPTQAMVMRWLPVIFVFIFAGFPAGLVIYWTWSNLLSVAQQWFITRKIEKETKHTIPVKKKA